MKVIFLFLSLLAFVNPLFSLSLETNIPDNSLYGAIKVQENISDLVYRLLSPNLKNQFYPGGPNVSSIKTIITGLKNLGIHDLEFFTNDEWTILIKLNTTRIAQVESLLIKVLNQENFMSQGRTIDTNNRLVFSKNTELEGSNFYLRKEGNYVLITPNKLAFSAWKTRHTQVKLYQEGTQKIQATPEAIGFLYDGNDQLYASNHPSFITVSTADNLSSLDISVIRQNISSNIEMPFFFKDHPLFFTTSTENLDAPRMERLKNLFVPITAFLPSFKLPIDALLTPSSGVKSFSVEFVDGDLVSVNEKKYDALNFALSFYFGDPQIARNFLSSYFKSNPIFTFSSQSSKDQEFFILTPKIPGAKELGFFPLYFLLNREGFLVLTLNRNAMLELASNMTKKKNTLFIRDRDSQPYSLYANVAEIIDRFPILNSLTSQIGIDLKAIKEVEESGEYKPYGDKATEGFLRIVFTSNN